MTKRKPEFDDSDIVPEAADLDSGVEVSTEYVDAQAHHSEPLKRLVSSGIVTADDSVVTWRVGHLEHLARQFAADPKQTWRDYWDDLTVALSASKPEFDALVEAARGE